MTRPTAHILGYLGIFVTFAISINQLLVMYMAGPVTGFLQTPIASLALWLAGCLSASATEIPMLAYWLYLGTYAGLLLVFVFCLWRLTFTTRGHVVCLLVLTLLGLCCDDNWLILATLCIGFFLPPKQAARCLMGVIFGILLVALPFVLGWTNNLPMLNQSGYWLGQVQQLIWSFAAFGFGYLAAVEQRGRLRLAAANAELQATQHLLSETVSAAERTRIARNLHDAIGHHLTALNLHLELAQRQPEPQAAIQTARELARDLLAEVRAVVSVEHGAGTINLQQALQRLCSGIPQPQIQLDYDAQLNIQQPHIAHLIFSCVQEGLTNALRHACASLIQIRVTQQRHEVLIQVSDNGTRTHTPSFAHGLNGMRERVREVAGLMQLLPQEGGGLCLRITLPAHREA